MRNDPATRSADGQKAAGPAAAAQVTTSSGGQSNPGWSFTGVFEAVLFLLAMLGAAVVLRRRQVVRRRELARRRRRPGEAPRRRRNARLRRASASHNVSSFKTVSPDAVEVALGRRGR